MDFGGTSRTRTHALPSTYSPPGFLAVNISTAEDQKVVLHEGQLREEKERRFGVQNIQKEDDRV